jgi:hypothetical protein
MLYGRKAVLGVPDHIGREQNKCDRRRYETAPALERVAGPLAHHGVTQDAERSVDHRLLGQEAKPDGDTEQHGEAHALPSHQHHPGVEHDRPEQDQGHVGGDQQRRVGYPGQRGEPDGRPEANARAVERASGEIDDHGGHGVEHRRGRPDAGLAVAAQLAGDADQPDDHRAAWRNSRRQARATKSSIAPRRARDRSWRRRPPRASERTGRRGRRRGGGDSLSP